MEHQLRENKETNISKQNQNGFLWSHNNQTFLANNKNKKSLVGFYIFMIGLVSYNLKVLKLYNLL